MSLVSGLLNQTITTISSVAKNSYGDVTISTVYSNVQCRWQEKIGRVVSFNGEVKDYTIEAWILPTYTILYDYEVIKDGLTYKMVNLSPKYSLSGTKDHIKLFLT